MNQKEILKMFSGAGAIITDTHVVYTSGRHGSAYVNKDALYPHTGMTARLCEEMASRFKDSDIGIVVGPTVGGVILSQWVAFYLSKIQGKEILGVFAEEDENKNRFLKRGYDKLIPGKNVLIVEDVMTTGGSVKKVVDAVRALGGNIVGCAALCNRGGVTKEDVGNVPVFEALVNIEMDSWEEAECPLCKKGVPVNTNVGKGREYLARRGQ